MLAAALNAENVLKGRSLFAEMAGGQVGSRLFTLVDDGTILDGPGAAPFDGEGVPSGRTELFTAGRLNGFLHDTYTAARMGGGQRSTGNAKRGSYKGSPGVGTSNFYLDNGSTSFDELLRQAEGGVLIAEVSGVHSGANPISGEFSVGATGLRIEGGVRRAAPRDDDRLHAAADAGRHHGGRRRPPVLLERRHAVGVDRRDDPRRCLACPATRLARAGSRRPVPRSRLRTRSPMRSGTRGRPIPGSPNPPAI